MTEREIEEAAQRQFQKDFPTGKWNRAAKWLRDQYREDVQKAPR